MGKPLALGKMAMSTSRLSSLKCKISKSLMVALGLIVLTGCAAQQQPPRDVSEVSSVDTVLLFGPSTSDASEEGVKITYAQASISKPVHKLF